MRDLTQAELTLVGGGYWGSFFGGGSLSSYILGRVGLSPSTDPYAVEGTAILADGTEISGFQVPISDLNNMFGSVGSGNQTYTAWVGTDATSDDPNTVIVELRPITFVVNGSFNWIRDPGYWEHFDNGYEVGDIWVQPDTGQWEANPEPARYQAGDYGVPVQEADFNTSSGGTFESLYPPGLYQVEFTPAYGSSNGPSVGGGEHRQFVYVPANGAPAQILSGNPINGTLTVLTGDFSTSDHYLNPNNGRNSMDVYRLDTGAANLQYMWATMTTVAQQISNANLSYDFTTLNSNSVFRTLVDAAHLHVSDVGLAYGFENNLTDEIDPGI